MEKNVTEGWTLDADGEYVYAVRVPDERMAESLPPVTECGLAATSVAVALQSDHSRLLAV